jgi:hypothetical protein
MYIQANPTTDHYYTRKPLMNNLVYPLWIENLYTIDSAQAEVVFHSPDLACVLSLRVAGAKCGAAGLPLAEVMRYVGCIVASHDSQFTFRRLPLCGANCDATNPVFRLPKSRPLSHDHGG